MTFQVQALPPHPWPLTVAGLTCYITESATDIGPEAPLDRPGFSAIRLAPGDNYRDEKDPRHVFEILKGVFTAASIAITELQYWGNLVVVVLEDPLTDMNTVPRSVGRCRCFYLYEHEMHRPRTLHLFCTGRVQADHTQYEVLRPGTMPSSGRSPRTSHTDTALVKLDELFENTMIPDTSQIPVDSNNFTGHTGIRVMASIRMRSGDPNQPWVQCRWDYMGQRARHRMADGVCGSTGAVLDESGQTGGSRRPRGHLQYARQRRGISSTSV